MSADDLLIDFSTDVDGDEPRIELRTKEPVIGPHIPLAVWDSYTVTVGEVLEAIRAACDDRCRLGLRREWADRETGRMECAECPGY